MKRSYFFLPQLIGIPFLFVSSLWLHLPSVTQADEEMESPYFVDEVHCDGIIEYSTYDLKWLYGEDFSKQLNHFRQRTHCNKVFEVFGIKKFQWLSREDLELLQFRLKRVPSFAQVEIELKKSKLVNHVHLFLHAKMRESNSTIGLQSNTNYSGANNYLRFSNHVQSKFTKYLPVLAQQIGLDTNHEISLDQKRTQIYNDQLYLETFQAKSDFDFLTRVALFANNVGLKSNLGIQSSVDAKYHYDFLGSFYTGAGLQIVGKSNTITTVKSWSEIMWINFLLGYLIGETNRNFVSFDLRLSPNLGTSETNIYYDLHFLSYVPAINENFFITGRLQDNYKPLIPLFTSQFEHTILLFKSIGIGMNWKIAEANLKLLLNVDSQQVQFSGDSNSRLYSLVWRPSVKYDSNDLNIDVGFSYSNDTMRY